MALGELLEPAYLGRRTARDGASRTYLGRSQDPLRLVLSERQTHRKKGVAAAKSRGSADVQEDVVVKR